MHSLRSPRSRTRPTAMTSSGFCAPLPRHAVPIVLALTLVSLAGAQQADDVADALRAALRAQGPKAAEVLMPDDLFPDRAQAAAQREILKEELRGAKIARTWHSATQAVARIHGRGSTSDLLFSRRGRQWVLASPRLYPVLSSKDLAPSVVRLTERVRNDGYGTSAWSFTHVTGRPDLCKNRMDVWLCQSGELHAVNGRIADVGVVPLDDMTHVPVGVAWRGSAAARVGSSYVVWCRDQRRDFFVKLRVRQRKRGVVELAWDLLTGGLEAPADTTTARPIDGPDGADGFAGMCADHDLEPSLVRGQHFEVLCDFRNDRVAQRALEAAEDLWRGAREMWSLPEKPLTPRLTIHLHRDPAHYEAEEAKLTKGRFKKNLAFAHPVYGAHVALQPKMSDAVLSRIGLNRLTRDLVRHEAAHLIRYRFSPNHRSHPDWLATGSAMWLRGPGTRDPERDAPAPSTSMLRMQRLARRGKLPKARDILKDELSGLSRFEGYDCRWLFFRLLMQQRNGAAMKRFLTKVRGLKEGGDFGERVTDTLRASLGSGTFRSLDARFRKSIDRLRPEWEEVYRSLGAVGDGLLQVAWDDRNAVAWKLRPARKRQYAIDAEIEILGGRGRQLNLLLGRSDTGFVSVAFVAGYGVTVFDYTAKGETWNRLGTAEVPHLVRDRACAVRAEVRKADIRVHVGGKVVLTVPRPARSLEGPFGLGAQRQTAGLWRSVRLR